MCDSAITRTLEISGLTKFQLIQKLENHSIRLNEYAEKLLSDDKFIPSKNKYSVTTVTLTVKDLGFPEGATMPQIVKRASDVGLGLCPLEVGPYLRLEYLDQPEGNTENHISQQAPTGSLTIASEIISEDDNFPKGFYIRKIDGELWLRGYVADDLHVWNSEDHFIFCR